MPLERTPAAPVYRGSLFADGFLRETIVESVEWRGFGADAFDSLERDLRALFARFPTGGAPNETQTEDDLVWPVLARLGWSASLRQQNLSARGRTDVPDGLMFADAAAKDRANGLAEEWRRYALGLALVESKRWRRPLDRRSDRPGEETAPSTQMLRYLRRADDLTDGKLRWGILTDGARWRLFFAGARSVSEQFFEIDLAALLGFPAAGAPSAPGAAERRHWLKAFALVFRRDAFLRGAVDGRTFHGRAIGQSRFYEQRVAASLSDLVFEQAFPTLARAIAAKAPDAPLAEVREAALILLYRLLFILYAEDRDLLPVRDPRYEPYALRERVRGEIGDRKDRGFDFPATADRYWSAIDSLCRAIEAGEAATGMPPYDGGLFDRARAPLLGRVRLTDDVLAEIVDALSFERTPAGRRYINYRDLGVRQLGSIYERLLEHEIVREDGEIAVRLNVFARKNTGSYYTPDDLVGLILRETLEPLIEARRSAFAEAAAARRADLARLDPAEAILRLKVCDPAMGSGHFLVNLVDYLSDRTLAAVGDAEALAEGYRSPLAERIAAIRATIAANAEAGGWQLDPERLDDRHVVRRMVLKRCVHGVDKNPMAVELAKVALWLHTFTAGAPLSFLDHHLRCGDSLFGSWARAGIDKAAAHGTPLLLHEPLTRATGAAGAMETIENLTDAEIAEADRSAAIFAEVRERTAPLDSFLSLVQALDWLDPRGAEDRTALHAFFDGQFGDPVKIARGEAEIAPETPDAERFAAILERARRLAAKERFLNWQAAFPGVWTNWQSAEREGGFDAVVGNPPWDRVKLQQIEWFAARRPEIARARRAADRKREIARLAEAGDPLAGAYAEARARAETRARMARGSDDYPLLSGGDVNLYSLFVERAMGLVGPEGMVGLLVPSGIASDKTAAPFFRSVATGGRLKALYDFENKKTFFPDVDSRFKFCVFVASPSPVGAAAKYAFYLRDVAELEDPERCFALTAGDFARVNPNTGTAPIFRSRRDAELTAGIHRRLPVLVDRSAGRPVAAWPVTYTTMFHMANDSGLFRTRGEIEEKEGAYAIGGNRFGSPSGEWAPLYEGKMVQAFDHRASDIVLNEDNLFRRGQREAVSTLRKSDPDRLPTPRYLVKLDAGRWPWPARWVVAFKDVTATTNMRTMIAAIIPRVGAGNTLPLLPLNESVADPAAVASMIVANLNAIPFDYAARQKVPATHFNRYVLEQLPVVPLERYEAVRFGPKTAHEIVRETVLELTCTAHDMAPFAIDAGHVDETGAARPPFPWDEERRLVLRARLDALFFHLYGVTGRDDMRHVYGTFPIVERRERARYGAYRSRDLCLDWMNALAAGDPDADVGA